MKVFRLCDKEEYDSILENKNFNSVGSKFKIDPKKNTHQYLPDAEYIHFFKKPLSLLYLSLQKGKYVCVYNIPESILQQYEGTGLYLDFIFFRNLHEITEYAVPNSIVKFDYLEKAFLINEDIDFDEYYPESAEEVMDSLTCVYDPKRKHAATSLDDVVM